jgi:hypothetical protein
MAYTVDDAIAAVVSAQAQLPADRVAYVRASVSITDAATGTITGHGALFRTDLLGTDTVDISSQFVLQRGGTGPQSLLSLNIEPIVTIVGPIVVRRPGFLVSFLQRLSLLFSRKHYRGDLAFRLQPHFNVLLTEVQTNPKLTGTIATSVPAPGPIVPPGTIEIVLESVEVLPIIP